MRSIILTILSIVIAAAILSAVIFLTADSPETFLNLPGLILVFGGTIIATCLSYPLKTISRAVRALYEEINHKKAINIQTRIKPYISAVTSLKKGNVRDVEKHIHEIKSSYLETALQMLMDGNNLDEIVKVLNWRLEQTATADKVNANVFRTMAGYAPAFGMVGTLIGLINMLDTMEAGEFSTIGANMAIALITTFYGVLLANLLFKPFALKLEQRLHEDIVMMNIAKEAVILLSQGKTSRYTIEALNNLISED